VYCPGCGTVASTNQKFCGSCGLDLCLILKLVDEDRSVADSVRLQGESSAKKLHRMPMILWGIGSIVTGMVLMIVDGQFPQHNWIGIAGVLLILTGTLIAAYGAFSPRQQIKSPLLNSPPQPAILPQKEPMGMTSTVPLEAQQSITEIPARTLDSVVHKELHNVHE